MASDGLFPDEPDETRVEILKATEAALRQHGYADLTIERIGEQFPKSKSLLYHHYESKDELLLDFLSYTLGRFEAGLGLDPDAGPHDRLTTMLDRALGPADRSGPDDDLRAAITELRAQAASDDEYRRHFTDHDRFFRERIAELVVEGIEAGVYRDVDPRRVATMIHTIVGGSMLQQATTTDARVETVRAELDVYFEHRLLADGQ